MRVHQCCVSGSIRTATVMERPVKAWSGSDTTHPSRDRQEVNPRPDP